jgi:thiol-disulfide isomerase/thioredoxin
MARWVTVLVLLAGVAGVRCGGSGGGDGNDASVTEATEVAQEASEQAGEEAKVEVCTPDCTGRQCGDNGCGGSCGSCYNSSGAVDPALCQQDGTCCTPSCAGKVCGDDGCGSQCGSCGDGLECVSGACQAPCTHDRFIPVKSRSIIYITGQEHPYLVYKAFDNAGTPQNVLVIESYQGQGGPAAPGLYTLNGANFKDAGLRLRIGYNCTANGCEKIFFGTSGTVAVESIGGAGVTLKALVNVRLVEVTIDGTTLESTEVPGGDSYCLRDYVIEEPIKADQPEPQCIAEGTGPFVNNNIANFKVQNCNEEWVSLHDLCGETKAVYFVLVAGWCPACHEFLPKAAQMEKDYLAAGKKMAMFAVLGEDAQNPPKPATPAYCRMYAQQHDMDPARVLNDPGYATFFSNVDPDITGDSFGIPWGALLDGDNMGYYWHSTNFSGPISQTKLEQLLDD